MKQVISIVSLLIIIPCNLQAMENCEKALFGHVLNNAIRRPIQAEEREQNTIEESTSSKKTTRIRKNSSFTVEQCSFKGCTSPECAAARKQIEISSKQDDDITGLAK